MLRTSVFALQKAFDVSRNQLPAYGRVFSFRKFFSGGHAVAARMLGNVHARIGYADNIFHGETVHRKTPHSKATGYVMLTERRVLGDPQAQAFSQNLCLLYSGLGHENNKFVTAVARHHVGLPALLFQ